MYEYPKPLKFEWMQSEITDEAVEWTKSFGKYLTQFSDGLKALTTSQIRKFFGELKRIQADPEKFLFPCPLNAVWQDLQHKLHQSCQYQI